MNIWQLNVKETQAREYVSVREMGSPMKKLQWFDVAFCDTAENLESALEQFRSIYEDFKKE